MFTKIPQKSNIKMALLAGEVTLALFVVILFICNCYPFGDNTFLMFDMKRQYVDYYSYLRSIYSGENDLFYSFSTTLGSGVFGFFVYYLSSPFLLLLALFPQSLLPLGIEVVIGIKLMMAAFVMNLFLQRFICCDYCSVIGALSWSLSSFIFAHSMNMMWIDVIILFPLVIWFLENVIALESKKVFSPYVPYIAAVSGIFYLNYYISYQVMIFIVLWLVVRFLTQKGTFSLCKVLQIGFNTLLGALLDAVFLVPAAVELVNSPKDITKLGLELTGRNLNPFEVFSKLGTLAYDMDEARFGDPQIFCGILFLILTVLFFMDNKVSKDERIGIATLFGAVLLSFCIDLLNLIWHAGMEPSGHPYRQAFVWIFLSIICSCRMMKDMKDELSLRNISIALGTIGIIFILSLSKRYDHVSTITILASWGLLLVVGSVLFVCLKVKERKLLIVLTIVLGLLQITDITVNDIYTYNYQAMNNNHMSDYQYVISDTSNVIDAIKEEDKTFYRMENLAPRQQNDAMQYNYNGITHYSSAGLVYARNFLQSIGFNDDTLYTDYGTNNTKLADSILGIKYLIGNESVKVHSDYTKKNVDSKETVYENPYALPLAVGVHEFEAPGDSVMHFNPFKLQEDIYQRVSGIDVSVFKNAIMSGEDYFKDGNKCSKYTVSPTINGELYMYIEGISEYTQGLAIEVNGEFKCSYGNSSSMQILNLGTFKAKDTVTVDVIGDSKDSIPGNPIFVTEDVNAIEDTYRNMKSMFAKVERVSSSHIMITAPNCTGLFLTIPYEEGWTVNVDGIITPVQKVYNALMYIPINSTADIHYIDLQYSPVGFNLGLILSVISLGIILILILKNIGVVDENKE